MLNVIRKLKGRTRFETLENFSMVSIIIGALVFSGGIGMTALDPKGVFAILSMLGAVIAFCASASLVFIWLAKEIFSKE